MERSNFFGDQLVVDSDLNNIETTTASQLIKRSQAALGTSGGIGHNVPAWVAAGVASGGIFGSPADYLTVGKNFYVDFPTGSSSLLRVYPGTAMDINGNLIYVASSVFITRGSTTSNTNWTSSPSATNYIKLSYQEASGSIKANDAGEQFYTRYTAGYFINIDSVVPLPTEILIATFVSDSSGQVSGTFTDRRTYVRAVTTADAVILDPTTKVVATINTLYDHAQAVGTGTPTVKNPHGLSAADIGFVVPSSSITEHRQSEHVSGILLDAKSAASFQSYSGSLGTPIGGYDVINFTAPTNAVLSVGGNIISSALPAISTQTAPGNGAFYICATSLGVTTFVSASVLGGLTLNNTENDPHGLFDTYLPLTLVQITGAAHDTVASATDVRRFYGMSPYDVRPDFSEPVSNATLLDTVSKINSLVDNLARMRYQIGVALNGSGSVWAPGSPNPLTAGAASNADAYHSHATVSLSNLFASNTGSFSIDATPYGVYVYQNTTGRSVIFRASVYAEVAMDGASEYLAELMCDANSLPTTQIGAVAWGCAEAVGAAGSRMFFSQMLVGVIPNGYYFRVKSTVTNAFNEQLQYAAIQYTP